jgi:hypothetical protein
MSSVEIPGDIPVTGTQVDADSGDDETITIASSGHHGRTLKVKTQNKRLQITVTSGDASFTLPLEKKRWHLTIGPLK